jgi:hypothetical protein
VAARALEAKLFEIDRRSKRTMDKEDVIRRLRESKEEDSETEYEDGKAAGRDWAQ